MPRSPRALELLRREGDTNTEISTLHTLGDTLTALGRTHEAAETWRRFLSLAHDPEIARETNEYDFDFDADDASDTIDCVKAKLAALTASVDE